MKSELQYVCGFAAKRSQLNVMNCVRISRGFCYATDGSASMKIAIDGPDLDVCVDAALLHDILRAMPDDQGISINPGPDHIIIKGGKRRLKLRTVPTDGMPEIEYGGDFHEIDPAVVSQALRFSLPATAVRDVARPYFSNVIINLTANGTFAVGCDSGRLHAFKIDDRKSEHDVTCAIPRALGNRLASLCEIGGVLKVNRNRVLYQKGDSTFVSVISGVEYPNWKRIIPSPDIYDDKAVVNGQALSSIVSAATALGVEYVHLALTEVGVNVTADMKGDEFSDQLDCDVAGKSEVNIRANYLIDVIAAMGKDKPLTIYFPNEKSPKSKGRPLLFTNGSDHIAFAMGSRV